MENKATVEGKATISMGNDNVLIMQMAHKSKIEISDAIEIVKAAEKIAGNKVHANLVDIRQMAFMSSDARKYFGDQDRSNVAAVGILMNSKLHRAIVNIYMKINKPVLPTKFFDNENKAKDWLRIKVKAFI
jgi:hypothetical protein